MKLKIKKINITKNKRMAVVVAVLLSGLLISMNSLFATKNKNKISEGNNSDSQKTSVEVVLVSSHNFAENINVSGIAKPMEEVLVSSKMSGKLISFSIEEGGSVNTGQVIAQIEQDAILLSSYNNARTGLINTIAAASQEVSNAELAVVTAESNLVNIKINTEESVKNAELTVEAAEIALAGAEKGLNNAGDNSEQLIKNAYDNMMVSLQSNLLIIKTSLTAMGDIIGEDPGEKTSNDDYESVLGVKNTQSLSNTKGMFFKARSSYENAYADYHALSVNLKLQEIESAAEEINEALNLAKDALNQTLIMLDKTITKSNFSSSDLSGLKTIVNNNLVAVTTAIYNLQASQQAIIGAGLADTNTVDNMSSSYNTAGKNLERTKQGLVLARAQAISQVDIYSKQLEAAKANLESAKKRTELQISSARAQVDLVSAQLSNTVITAPISGILNKRLTEVGEMALAGSPVAGIVNADSIKIELAVTEFDIGKINEGQEVDVFLSVYPEENFQGIVYYVGLTADTASKKYPVKIQITNNDKKIKAGMVAEVKIIFDDEKRVLAIPETTLFDLDDQKKVYVVNESSKIEVRTVDVDSISESHAFIKSGVVEGEKIVANGNLLLTEGEEINIK
ncbi:MAG: efflux RND transporter periplasmic adaptor subunit [Patescibacteria group bacterium]|nr:efflux RND transporter periplasmic adaptor subunit [Patescibacteria group bacterium]